MRVFSVNFLFFILCLLNDEPFIEVLILFQELSQSYVLSLIFFRLFPQLLVDDFQSNDLFFKIFVFFFESDWFRFLFKDFKKSTNQSFLGWIGVTLISLAVVKRRVGYSRLYLFFYGISADIFFVEAIGLVLFLNFLDLVF